MQLLTSPWIRVVRLGILPGVFSDLKNTSYGVASDDCVNGHTEQSGRQGSIEECFSGRGAIGQAHVARRTKPFNRDQQGVSPLRDGLVLMHAQRVVPADTCVHERLDLAL